MAILQAILFSRTDLLRSCRLWLGCNRLKAAPTLLSICTQIIYLLWRKPTGDQILSVETRREHGHTIPRALPQSIVFSVIVFKFGDKYDC